MRPIRSALPIGCVLAISLTLSACSTKGSDSGGSSSTDGVKTDVGVTDDAIRLGILTDNSGALKTGGLAITAGNELWAEKVNDSGGICGRDIELDAVDHGYKPDNALPLYDQTAPNVVGFVQVLGSAVIAALKQKLTNDNVVAIPAGWSSVNLDTPSIVLVGGTYDVDTINSLSHLQSAGAFKDGESVGVIYLDSEAGQNVNVGAKYYAEQHSLNLIEQPVSASDTDMTATITKMKSEGARAIAMLTSPDALASAALQSHSQQLEIPIVAMSSTFTPDLLEDPGTAEALENVIVAQPFIPYNSDEPIAKEIREAYAAGGYSDPPAQFIFAGYSAGLAWEAILNAACKDGDLTRAGIMEIRQTLTDVDTKGLTGDLDLSHPGAPPSRETVLETPAAGVEGSLELLEANVQSPEAESYKAPFEE